VKTIFIGHFAPLCRALEEASSPAGNQVQRKIIKELSLQCDPGDVFSYSMTPEASWPRGPFISRSLIEGSVEFLGYPNLPVLKHIIFAFRVFIKLIMTRPKLSLQYNSYFFENTSFLLYRLCFPDSVLAIFIQDIHVNPSAPFLSKLGFRSFFERASLWLSRHFNIIVPISEAIVDDFCIDRNKCIIFLGGLTDSAIMLMKKSEQQILLNIGIFAGALEPHNGIDRLVNQWISSRIQWPLHVFGRGSLSQYLKKTAESSENIIFHGFQPEYLILEWQSKARWNFCLRYSSGLNQRYFFPSKLFNILCASGAVLTNSFHGLPDVLRKHIYMLSDDLSDLPEKLARSIEFPPQENVRMRHKIVAEKYSWGMCIEKIIGNKLPNTIPRILCFVSHYLPGYKAGGALRSVSNIAQLIGTRCDFKVVTSNCDLGDDQHYLGLKPGIWIVNGKAKVFYLSNYCADIFSIFRKSQADVIYLNSFFSPKFSIFPLILWNFFFRRKIKFVLAPRGEFSPGALKIKNLKKRSFIKLSKFLRIYRNVIWHASSDYESHDIQRELGVPANRILISCDVTMPSDHFAGSVSPDKSRVILRLCFVSRITKKKNLDYAISVLRSVDVPVVFNIYGSAEDKGYLLHCQNLAADLPENIDVVFHGSLEHSRVLQVFSNHHLFFFPTLGENYGHVIAESLGVGTPVLLSDQTPWRNIERLGVGWDYPLSEPSRFVEAIHKMSIMDEHTYTDMRNAAKIFLTNKLNLETTSDEVFNSFFAL